jgi:diguanylate cyclase (GGDEF)-like protein
MPIHDEDSTVVLRGRRRDHARLRKSHASLIVLEGADIGRDFRLRKGETVLGRGPEADVRVLDELASREHARIDCRWDGPSTSYSLTDLDSTNRTFVNSQAIETVELEDGDKIQIGDTMLKFVVLDDIEAKFHAEVRHRITYDQLTGLLTRESLCMALERELGRCERYGMPLGLLMMDLDRFKSINDTHGHQMGSHVLAEVGRLLRWSIRDADVSARYGGEEFVSYLAETDGEGALHAAERIRRAIEEHHFNLDGPSVGVTVSIGVAMAPEHGCDIETLMRAADRALYRAKAGGRNRVVLADD